MKTYHDIAGDGALQFEPFPNIWIDGHLEWLHRHALARATPPAAPRA